MSNSMYLIFDFFNLLFVAMTLADSNILTYYGIVFEDPLEAPSNLSIFQSKFETLQLDGGTAG